MVGEDDTASSLYYSSLLQENESVENRYNYIYYLYVEGDYGAVISEAGKAVEKYPGYSRFYKIKALAYEKLGDRENYSSTLASLMELEPYDEELRNLYLDSLLALEETEKAYDFSKETIILFPEDKKAIEVLAETSSFYQYLDSLNKEETKETKEEDTSTIEETESTQNTQTLDGPTAESID